MDELIVISEQGIEIEDQSGSWEDVVRRMATPLAPLPQGFLEAKYQEHDEARAREERLKSLPWWEAIRPAEVSRRKERTFRNPLLEEIPHDSDRYLSRAWRQALSSCPVSVNSCRRKVADLYAQCFGRVKDREVRRDIGVTQAAIRRGTIDCPLDAQEVKTLLVRGFLARLEKGDASPTQLVGMESTAWGAAEGSPELEALLRDEGLERPEVQSPPWEVSMGGTPQGGVSARVRKGALRVTIWFDGEEGLLPRVIEGQDELREMGGLESLRRTLYREMVLGIRSSLDDSGYHYEGVKVYGPEEDNFVPLMTSP